VALPDEPCLVLADSSALARVLSNLLGNAVQHGETMTRLQVALASEDGAHTLRITNDGTQLPEDVERLFERGVAGAGGGTGLGLSIARDLVERMGGQLGLETEGAVTFALTLPAAD
jgi:signal transduction histidine kinase